MHLDQLPNSSHPLWVGAAANPPKADDWNWATKGGLFSESVIRFSDLQISKKKNIPNSYPDLEIYISRQ